MRKQKHVGHPWFYNIIHNIIKTYLVKSET